MEAPEKIYLPSILVANTVRYKEEGFIEYARADAFIEKACAWLSQQEELVGISFEKDFYERFKKYMEDE